MKCKKCGIELNKDSVSCWSCGFTNNPTADDSKTRPKWFVAFLFVLMAHNLIYVINNIAVIATHEQGLDILTVESNILIVQMIFFGIEIGILVLFLFFMKRKLLIGYYVFLLVNSLVIVFTSFSVWLFIRYLATYFVFSSQWGKFKK